MNSQLIRLGIRAIQIIRDTLGGGGGTGQSHQISHGEGGEGVSQIVA